MMKESYFTLRPKLKVFWNKLKSIFKNFVYKLTNKKKVIKY
jgi:hypothetical protein